MQIFFHRLWEVNMNTLRQTCAAIILSLALVVSALAGQIDSPGKTNPPPPPTETTEQLGIVDVIKAIVEKILQ